MSDLTAVEKAKLERLFRMDGGYVMNFTNDSMTNFVAEVTGLDFDARKYVLNEGTSKAKRLRVFWKVEPNHVVGKLTQAMIDLEEKNRQPAYQWGSPEPDPEHDRLLADCRNIAARLLGGAPVQFHDLIEETRQLLDVDAIATEVRHAIDANRLQEGIDRLHTFTVAFVRYYARARGVPTPDEPIETTFGNYRKALGTAGLIDTAMTDAILRSTIGMLGRFNPVRNHQSLAHPPERLVHAREARLIFNHVLATLRFVRDLEAEAPKAAPKPDPLGDLGS